MTATQWAAWVGTCSGLASLFWNIYTKVTAGPRLRVVALANQAMVPEPQSHPKFLRVIVQNTGTGPTTISSIAVQAYRSRWARIRHKPSNASGLLNGYRGPQLPYKLEVGGEFQAILEQDQRFNEWLSNRNLCCAVVHSFSKNPATAKISCSSE